MTITPTAIYIGHPQVGEYVKKSLAKDWKFAPSVETIDEFIDGINDGLIDNNIDAIFILDLLTYDKTEEEQTVFAEFVAEYSNYVFFAIINYIEDSTFVDKMRQRVDQASFTINNEEEPRYYLISRRKPMQTFDQAVTHFIEKPPLNAVASAAHLQGEEYVEEDEGEDYLHEQENTPYEEQDTNNAQGKVIAVTSSKGGSGKSTIAITLATCLSRTSINSVKEGLEKEPLKVIIVDFDVRDGQLGFATGNTKPSMAKISKIPSLTEQDIREVTITHKHLKCDLLLAPKRVRFAEEIQTDFFVELIHRLRKMYDYIILDTSVRFTDPLLEEVAYPMADFIIFVTDIVVTSMYSMKRWIEETTSPKHENGMGINPKKIAIVVNKNQPNIKMPTHRIKQATMNLPIISSVPNASQLIAEATNLHHIEQTLHNKGVFEAIYRIAKAVTGSEYKLSQNHVV